MLKKLDTFLIKSYIGPLMATFFVAEFIFLMQFLWKYIDDMVGKGLAWSIISELMLYASASLVPMSLPLAVLLASIMTFGNLGEYNELIAIKSSGVSLKRIMRPLIVFNFGVGCLAFLFTNNVMPYTNLKMHSLLYDVRHQRPELNIKKGVYYKGIKDIVIKIRDKEPERNMLYDIMIYDHRSGRGNMNVTVADSAEMRFSDSKNHLLLTLFNGASYEEIRDRKNYKKNKQNIPAQRQHFEKQTICFPLEGFGFKRSDEELFKNNYQMMDVFQLDSTIDSLQAKMNERELKFYKRLLPREFFKSQIHDLKGDSVAVDLDSMLQVMTLKQTAYTYANAVGYARTVKSQADSFFDDNRYRMRWINKHKVAWHNKFTLAVACVLLFLIGAPLGAIVRKGGLGIPLVISVVIFIFYYIFSMTGEKYVKVGEVTALQGMWFSPLVILTIGIWLTYLAQKEAKMKNAGSFFKKIFKFIGFNKMFRSR